ncbi:putative fumarylacetoacetate hydrolase [Xylogone sp. PMI_703]|nr:putative fumarylacetoacetate hydrolase [Xylogone sp. PMI_703]
MGFIPTIARNSPFSFANIPFGVISTKENPKQRCAIAIGEHALDLQQYSLAGYVNDFSDDVRESLTKTCLNTFAALSAAIRTKVRAKIIEDLRVHNIPESFFEPLKSVTMHLPMRIGGYTDFTSSLEHMTNIPQNFFSIPLAYNGRVSSVVVSECPVKRPVGVFIDQDTKRPINSASRCLDFELEMGYFVSQPIGYGQTITIENAKDHIFGFVLLNDWSTRDIQVFEMPPLGPFLSKGFATTISPWIVTMDAIEQFSCSSTHTRNPQAAEYLVWKDRTSGNFDIKLSVKLIRNGIEYPLCSSNLKYLYWNPYQQLTHHASGMCGLETGDLIGTGTISGNGINENGEKFELGCLFEATKGGSAKLKYENGTEVGYLEDGDEVIMTAWCGAESPEHDVVLGFGDCRGIIVPASQ